MANWGRLKIGGTMESLFPLKSKYWQWLMLAAAGVVVVVLAVLLDLAERNKDYPTAQACLVAILALLVLTAWSWWRTNHKPPQLSGEAGVYYRAISKLLVCVTIGYSGIILNANRFDRWQDGIVARAIGYGTLVAGAFFVCGLLLGLLFGFRPASQSSDDQSLSARKHPFTNLEEIADWLTKLILGAGLVTLTSWWDPIRKFARFMAKGVDPLARNQTDNPGSPAVALAIMLFFFASGILYGYLWTRYEHEIAEDTYDDTSALALVTRWLNAPNPPDDQTRVDMMNAIKNASLAAKLRIFLQAEQYRMPSTQDVSDRSLPVFQALVEADLQEIFHRNRGQYALALMGKKKDPKNPEDDWKHALDLLNNALRIRDGFGEKGWQEYELARAVCQIHLDPNLKNGQASTPEQQQSIRADLAKATSVPDAVSKALDNDDVIGHWKAIKDNQCNLVDSP
jgi:hypothetical protein